MPLTQPIECHADLLQARGFVRIAHRLPITFTMANSESRPDMQSLHERIRD